MFAQDFWQLSPLHCLADRLYASHHSPGSTIQIRQAVKSETLGSCVTFENTISPRDPFSVLSEAFDHISSF